MCLLHFHDDLTERIQFSECGRTSTELVAFNSNSVQIHIIQTDLINALNALRKLCEIESDRIRSAYYGAKIEMLLKMPNAIETLA